MIAKIHKGEQIIMKNYLTKRNNDNFGLNFFEDAFNDFFMPTFFDRRFDGNMRTDVKETKNGYSLCVDMPGFDKNDINVSLDNGYLTISAKREQNEDDGDSFIKRERSFSCQRSYYVGDGVTEKDVKAKYLNGTLSLEIPKKTEEKQTKRVIEID